MKCWVGAWDLGLVFGCVACGVSFSGDIQDPPEQGPLQPAVGDPASAGGLDEMTHRGPFQPRPFSGSVLLLPREHPSTEPVVQRWAGRRQRGVRLWLLYAA